MQSKESSKEHLRTLFNNFIKPQFLCRCLEKPLSSEDVIAQGIRLTRKREELFFRKTDLLLKQQELISEQKDLLLKQQDLLSQQQDLLYEQQDLLLCSLF